MSDTQARHRAKPRKAWGISSKRMSECFGAASLWAMALPPLVRLWLQGSCFRGVNSDHYNVTGSLRGRMAVAAAGALVVRRVRGTSATAQKHGTLVPIRLTVGLAFPQENRVFMPPVYKDKQRKCCAVDVRWSSSRHSESQQSRSAPRSRKERSGPAEGKREHIGGFP